MNRKLHGVFTTGAVALIATASLAAPSPGKPSNPGKPPENSKPKFSIQEIVVPWETECAEEAARRIYPRRLNEKGELVGYTTCYTATGDPTTPYAFRDMRGFAWRPNVGGQFLPSLAASSAIAVFARDINESGLMVGYEGTNVTRNALRWTFSGGVEQPYTVPACGPSNVYATAAGINDDGDIIGEARVFDQGSNSCVIKLVLVASDGQQTIGPPGHATRINNSRVAIGRWIQGLSSGEHFVWSPTDGKTVLGVKSYAPEVPSFVDYLLYDINAYGDVVGHKSTGDCFSSDGGSFRTSNTPRLFGRDGATVTLPALVPGASASAYGVNDNGDIVGVTETVAFECNQTLPNPRVALLWKDGVVYNLNWLIPKGSGITLTSAFAINNAGQISAYGTVDAESEKPCGAQSPCKSQYGFLLTPIGKGRK